MRKILELKCAPVLVGPSEMTNPFLSNSCNRLGLVKALIVPATSDRYKWKPKQVATMSGSRGIYIWAQKPFAVKEEVVSCQIVTYKCHMIFCYVLAQSN